MEHLVDSIPFNALIVGPTNSGKSKFVVTQLRGPFDGNFDYVVLICPTFIHNKTYANFGAQDPHLFIVQCAQHEVELWLKVVTIAFEGTNTLLILDACAASKHVKGSPFLRGIWAFPSGCCHKR